MKRIPVLATIVVLCAVATMIGLGVWQLHRMAWKEELLARYEAALTDDTPVAWPSDTADFDHVIFRRSSVSCATDTGAAAVSGRNGAGEAGIVHIHECLTADGTPAAIQLGWSRNPAAPPYDGTPATGRIAPYGDKLRLVADPPLAGLEANASPDPSEIPNNHFAYALQWFFFAATALVIYGLALKRRLARKGERG